MVYLMLPRRFYSNPPVPRDTMVSAIFPGTLCLAGARTGFPVTLVWNVLHMLEVHMPKNVNARQREGREIGSQLCPGRVRSARGEFGLPGESTVCPGR
eukprot:g15493.t1